MYDLTSSSLINYYQRYIDDVGQKVNRPIWQLPQRQSFLQVYHILSLEVFHWILCLCWVPNTTKKEPNNMKSTWPTPVSRIGDPTQTPNASRWNIDRVGGNANFSIFRYQHVGIPNTKLLCWGYCPTRRPNASVFTSQWNIGFNLLCTGLYIPIIHVQMIDSLVIGSRRKKHYSKNDRLMLRNK